MVMDNGFEFVFMGWIQLMLKFAVLLFVLLLSSCNNNGPQYNGYIDADLSYLSSNFAGRLTKLLVHRGQAVHQHQLLFKLEQTSEKYGVEISRFNKKNLKAQREELLSQIQYDEINYHRNLKMREKDARQIDHR